jgi:DNA-binding transcriptional ArsR family regulator
LKFYHGAVDGTTARVLNLRLRKNLIEVKKVEPIHSFGNIKLLADPRRMEILRLLMASPATLTNLARTLKQSPAWIRHHILALESASLVEVSEIRKTGKVTEKFYRAKADALLLQEIILPKTKKSAVIFSGSHDLALEGIAEHLQKHVMLLSARWLPGWTGEFAAGVMPDFWFPSFG